MYIHTIRDDSPRPSQGWRPPGCNEILQFESSLLSMLCSVHIAYLKPHISHQDWCWFTLFGEERLWTNFKFNPCPLPDMYRFPTSLAVGQGFRFGEWKHEQPTIGPALFNGSTNHHSESPSPIIICIIISASLTGKKSPHHHGSRLVQLRIDLRKQPLAMNHCHHDFFLNHLWTINFLKHRSNPLSLNLTSTYTWGCTTIDINYHYTTPHQELTKCHWFAEVAKQPLPTCRTALLTVAPWDST